MGKTQIALLFLIILIIWVFTLYSRIYKKEIRKCVMAIGILLVFWVMLRTIRNLVNLQVISKFIWYLYYVAIIFIPTIYYLCTKIIFGKTSKKSYIVPIIISTILLILVLTNDLHYIVFSEVDANWHYNHNIGYFIVTMWIFYEFILSNILLTIRRWNIKKDWKVILIFLPILLGIVYTILYVNEISIFRKTDMSVILGALILTGLECVLRLELIPNNIRYRKPFKNSNLNMALISNSGELVLNTLNKIEIPEEIIEDIKENKAKDNYYGEFQVSKISNGYAISKRDVDGIKKLREEIHTKNIELKKQETLLIDEQSIKQNLRDIEMKNQINEEIEDKISEKKQKIEEILSSSKTIGKKELSQIKLLVSYCKRMGTLVISTHNSEKFNLERIRVILDELLEDFKVNDIRAVYGFKDIFSLSSKEMSELYSIIFEILTNIQDVDIQIIIRRIESSIILKIRMDKEISKIKIDKEIKQIDTEDGTVIEVQF